MVFCADSHNNDQVGKSVAIIVGVFGGLAVLVVLLSICKKAAGNHFTKNYDSYNEILIIDKMIW
jgi:hypothetical protein